MLAIVPSLAVLGLIVSAAPGCKKKDSAAPAAPAPSGAALASGGQKVFASHNCGNCHAINGQGGRGGPDLGKVGGEHDAQWIVAHVRNPQSHKPGSRMPAFEGKISDAELASLGAYLASLK